MIDVESWEEIRRAYYLDQKSIREIERETGHAWRTVKRIIESGEPSKYVLKEGRDAPKLGPYREEIGELLKQNQHLPVKQRYTSSRIYQLLREKGFTGSESTVRHYVGQVRKAQRKPAVFLPLAFDPGQDAQVDWGEAEVILAGVQVTVQLFVMRLCYSRRTFVMAFPSQKQEAFFQGHVEAFQHFGGVPRRLTYDNLTTAVQKILQGKERQEQERFLTLRGMLFGREDAEATQHFVAADAEPFRAAGGRFEQQGVDSPLECDKLNRKFGNVWPKVAGRRRKKGLGARGSEAPRAGTLRLCRKLAHRPARRC
jgi:transposase